jgi:hypothetical protein
MRQSAKDYPWLEHRIESERFAIWTRCASGLRGKDALLHQEPMILLQRVLEASHYDTPPNTPPSHNQHALGISNPKARGLPIFTFGELCQTPTSLQPLERDARPQSRWPRQCQNKSNSSYRCTPR